MDVSLLINQRLQALGLGQKDLARAAEVTESYVSQLLTRKKAPPAPARTDIYEKMERCLKLPRGNLARLASLERKARLERELGDELQPLFAEVRTLILRKCAPEKVGAVRAVFEQQPFGELERLVTDKMLDVAKQVARAELGNERWLRRMTRLSGRSYAAMRVVVLEFLDADTSALSARDFVSFLDPLIRSWDIDLATFDLEIVLVDTTAAGQVKRFGFVERTAGAPLAGTPGLEEFLRDPSMSGTATAEEVAYLRRLPLDGRRPTALYYYRELQNLRDPLHFRSD